jgi:hypothetical protein
MARRHPSGGPSSGRPTLTDLPYHLEGATDFTRDRRHEVHDPVEFLGHFLAEPDLSADFLRDTDFNHPEGRPRDKGHWGLVHMAFTDSPHGAMLPFWRQFVRDDALLERCGFRQPDGRLWRPSYPTMCARFKELTRAFDAFLDGTRRLIGRARSFEPQIGAHVTFDGTMVASHARALHDCPDGSCPDARRGRLKKLDTERAKKMRQRQAEIDQEDENASAAEVVLEGLQAAEATSVHPDPERGGVSWFSGTHWWWCADPDAGPRAYKDQDTGKVRYYWVGDLPVHAFETCVGGMVGALTRPANTDEHTGFEELLDQVSQTIGAQPLSVGVDKGYYWTATYLAASRRGVAMIGPHRREPNDPVGAPAPAGPRWDTHGDPRCGHCGGRTRRIGFSTSGGRPRITFSCIMPQGPDCDARQIIDCSNEPRRLVALSRRSKVYRALYRARGQFERGHNQMRRRYNVAASDIGERSRVLGAGARHQRTLSAMLVDWIRICLRHGWIGPGPLLGAKRIPFVVPPLKEPSPDTERKRKREAKKRRRPRTRRKTKPPPS